MAGGGGGTQNVLTMLKGGTTSFEVVLTQVFEVLVILMGGHKKFPPFKKEGGA